ncbi:DNA-directed RNA polymerase sigma-70 factor [Thermaurantimonas aggregans]|uniref:DNA-directed RNA polymerase sigma-70 factor n=1 Tax=Thermaurantimonas aggregans TaxID=2173829 RepID=A0A401XHU4_9FLAO|nr:sigma-70 family RNA polymerase sigma factor [Thermaurantimonas aggregans]MCX8149434.1 sigma-70 family RNA polymerase sigma factor [Thermaurantimonas aggregans]GCD76579.1 DNA-directed RNA polymerase sigma-70 factor [Thermaurantimonas aggregans]
MAELNKENLDGTSINLVLEQRQSSSAGLLGWIERLLKGEYRAEEEIYKYIYQKQYAVAYRYVNNHDDAIEIFNSAMVKVFKHIKSLDDYEKIESWIKKIIINTALDFLRTNKRHKVNLQPIEDDLKKIPVTAAADSAFEYDYLIQLVHQLPQRKRMVFMLYAIEGFSHKEIAETLNISESNSKLLLHEARKFLQSKLNKKA